MATFEVVFLRVYFTFVIIFVVAAAFYEFIRSRTGIKLQSTLENLAVLIKHSTPQTEVKVTEKQNRKIIPYINITIVIIGILIAISIDAGFPGRFACIIASLISIGVIYCLPIIDSCWRNLFLYVDTIVVLIENARLSLSDTNDSLIREREDKWQQSQEQWKQLLLILDEKDKTRKSIPLSLTLCSSEKLISEENRKRLRKLRYNVLYNQEKNDGSFYLNYDARL